MAGGSGSVFRDHRSHSIFDVQKVLAKESGIQESAGYGFGFRIGIEEVEGDSQSLMGCCCKI